MTRKRAVHLWVTATWGVFPPLVMAAIVLRWAPVVQVVLMAVAAGAIVATDLALNGTASWRRSRTARRSRRGRLRR